MISTRLYNPDIEFFRRNDRGFGMPLTQHQPPDQYETGSHLSSHTTPSSEAEQRATSGSRKRVPVACERCRKRKIKCSGNEGNNQSCANCINAGHEDTCRFLRVSSIEPGAFNFRGWQGPPRYSPYSLPMHHRLNYVSMPSRYSPPTSLQYPTVPTNVDYGGYSNPSPNVEWTRTSYVPYSPYPDEEESSPYSSQVQPPPYILPNTDPMSTTNAYYMHAQGVRPHHASLWPEPQNCMPQANAQLASSGYSQGPQSIHTMVIAGNPPSDRVLPTPISARSIVSSNGAHIDNTPVTSSGQQNSSCWSGGHAAPTHHSHSSAHVNTDGARDTSIERANASYMPYAHIGLNDTLTTTALSHGIPLTVNDIPNSTATGTPEDSHGSGTSLRTVSRGSLKATPESTSAPYSYIDPMAGHSSQLRSASGQLSNGSLYCRTQPMVTRREPASDDCSPDCSSCQTDSARASVLSIGNTSQGY